MCYEIVKSVRECKGEEEKYVSWREPAKTAIGQYAVSHNGIVLNFDAIMAALDFVLSDKRPIHIIEQELSVLSQGK